MTLVNLLTGRAGISELLARVPVPTFSLNNACKALWIPTKWILNTKIVRAGLVGLVVFAASLTYRFVTSFVRSAPTKRRLQRGTRGKGRRILYPPAFSNLHVLAERLVDKVADRRDMLDMERRLFTELELQGLELYRSAETAVVELPPRLGDASVVTLRVAADQLTALEKQHFVSSAVEYVLSDEYVSNVVEERRENWLVTNALFLLNGQYTIPGAVSGLKARLALAWNDTLGRSLVEPRL